MRKLIIAALTLLITTGAMAQSKNDEMSVRHSSVGVGMPVYFEFGPRIGINYANVKGMDTQGIAGFMIGGFGEMRCNIWFGLSLDVLFSAQGVKYKDKNIKDVNSYVVTPLLANFYIVDRFALKLGVQPALMVDAQRFPEGKNRYSIAHELNRFEISVPVGASYTFTMLKWQWQADLRYNFGLNNIYKNATSGNSNLSLSLAIKL